MMKRLILRFGLCILMVAVCASSLWSQTTCSPDISNLKASVSLDQSKRLQEISVAGYLAEMRSEQMAQIINFSDKGGESFDIRTGKRDEKSESGVGRKNPIKAFFYSALIPGGGQLYNGSKWKALIFAGIETIAWTGRVSYNSKGDDKTDEFNDFADRHWSEDKYEDFLWANWTVRDDDSVWNNSGFSIFTHHLPSTKTQQYYEMIGKYNQFIYGWDDMNPETTDADAHFYATSVNRLDYEEMRGDANSYYDNAKTSLIVVMFNHILSGTEAALAARKINRNSNQLAQRLSFKAYAVNNEQESYPMLGMTYRF